MKKLAHVTNSYAYTYTQQPSGGYRGEGGVGGPPSDLMMKKLNNNIPRDIHCSRERYGKQACSLGLGKYLELLFKESKR